MPNFCVWKLKPVHVSGQDSIPGSNAWQRHLDQTTMPSSSIVVFSMPTIVLRRNNFCRASPIRSIPDPGMKDVPVHAPIAIGIPHRILRDEYHWNEPCRERQDRRQAGRSRDANRAVQHDRSFGAKIGVAVVSFTLIGLSFVL